MLDFANRLKSLRKLKKLKQSDLALFLDITVRHYQDIEYGKINIPTLTLIKLADYFNVSLDYLVGRSDDPTRHWLEVSMPSNIPMRGLRMPDELYLKLKYIAKMESRSYNQEAVYILQKYVAEYEKENGSILVSPDDLYQ